MPPFSSHRNINKGSFRDRRWRGKWHTGPATLKPCYRRLLMMSTGTSSSDVSKFTEVALSFVNTLTEQATETVKIRTLKIRNRGWTEQSVMRLTIVLPHTTPVFCQETWVSTRHRATLSDGQSEPLNAGTGRELSHISSSMTHVVGTEDHLFLWK